MMDSLANQRVVDGRALIIAATPAVDGGGIGWDTPVLGIGLARRLALSGRRAGFDRVLIAGRLPAAAGEALRDTGARILAPGEPLPVGRLVVVASRVVATTRWLAALADLAVEPGSVATDGGIAAVADNRSDAEAPWPVPADREGTEPLAFLPAGLAVRDRRLPAAGRLPLTDRRELPEAECWLLRTLIKDSEGFMSRHVERPLSLAITRRLCRTGVTPNAMTLISVGVGLASAPFFLSAEAAYQVAGALLLLVHSVLDGCDGELARLTFQESRWGGILDFWGDNVVHFAVFAAMMVGAGNASGSWWPYAAGASAIVASAASAAVVYWHTMLRKRDRGPLFTSVSRADASPLARVLDALARRDFLYLVLVLAVFGKAAWFLAVAGVGAPVFLIALLTVVVSDHARGVRT